jgi:hypothetical protein
VAAFGTARAPLERRPVDAAFGGRLRLAEVANSTTAQPGGAVVVSVAWQRVSPQDGLEGLAWYAHLVGPDGTLVAQHDALVGGGYGWPGTEALLADRRGILVPAGVAPGAYHVRIGVYGTDGPLAGQGKDAGPGGAVQVAVTIAP